MTAVDTNVIVRLLVEDDARQSAAARAVFEGGPVWIAKTVLLETEWVLRSLYQLEVAEIQVALRRLAGLSGVRLEDEAAVVRAFDLCGKGLDFADALHLSSRAADARFVTFDRALVRRAKKVKVRAVDGLH